MSLNVGNLIFNLHQMISSTTTSADILIYSKAIEQLKLGSVFSVVSYDTLPDIDTVEKYALYLVENESLIYIANKTYNKWIPLVATNIGQALSWGYNLCGLLGTGVANTCNLTSPVSVTGGFADWTDIAVGQYHSTGLRSNGTIWSWGRNSLGQLGDGTAINRSSPVSVTGGFNDWCQITSGRDFLLALRNDGSLWAWGCGYRGGLGVDSFSICRSSPVSVVGGFTDWCDISAGILHSAAVRTNCSLWTWGGNTVGQLGDNTTVSRASPASIINIPFGWCRVSAGYTHAVALTGNGYLWSWGNNTNGSLGDGSTDNRSSPVSVVGGFNDWCQIAAGDESSAAIRTNGSIWMWGCNTRGTLGDNTVFCRSSPVSVVGGYTDWCYVRLGEYTSSAIRSNGTLWTWGSNCNGILGNGSEVSVSSPVSVVGGFADWTKIDVGTSHAVGIRCLDF